MAESIHQSHDYGQFKVFYQYVGTPEQDDDRPAMILGSQLFGRRSAWVIPLDVAHQYADSQSGAPTPYLIEASIKICEMFGLWPDNTTVRKVADAIVDCLPDLLKMPPKPIDDTQRMVEEAVEKHGLALSVNGERVIN